MEVDGVFLDVCCYGKEILIDEIRDFVVGIGFGLQPNARASNRSSAEVEKQGLLISLCLSDCRVKVFVPLNSHFQSLLETKSNTAIAFLFQPQSGLTIESPGAAITSNLRFNQSTCETRSPSSGPTNCSVASFKNLELHNCR
jgi:hypothetical protein